MNIGLVLSGGMAKGAYQVGALNAISEFLPINEIKYISCASIGVLNGYAYATGKLKCAEEMWKNACIENVPSFVSTVLKSDIIQKTIESIHNKSDRLDSVVYASFFDILHRNVVYKNLASIGNQEIPLYLKASVALPIYNKPVALDGTSYFDGAMIDNIPVFPLLNHELDYVICIYFDDTSYKFESACFDNKVIKITFPSESVLKQSLVFTKGSINQMMNDGFNRTTDILSSVFMNGYNDIEYVHKVIENKNANETQSLRITGDVLVTNLNKVAQKFAKRRIEL